MKFPFYPTPLRQFPYNSRVYSHEFTPNKDSNNYVLLAFVPGNALQAAELNEVQELFYKTTTLNNLLLKNWLFIGAAGFSSGSSAVPINGPSWIGAVPLDPISGVTASDNSVTFKTGWYLVDDKSGLKFWVYNNQDHIVPGITNGDYVGLTIFTEYVTPSEDPTLKDNTSSGADRYRMMIGGAFASTDLPNITTSPYRAVLRYRSITGSGNNTLRFTYLNNLLL